MAFAGAKQFNSVFLIVFSFILCAQSDVPTLHGVPLSKASLYSPSKDFTCFDGSVTIPFNYVNDDYCDCFDGSDEPGTSACLNGIFYCANVGHQSQNITSSKVNDGVCDCCDGTDEYASPGTCVNVCDELGKEARELAIKMAELYKAGSNLRKELVDVGSKKRKEMAEQLSQLEKDKTDAQTTKAEKEALKNELESKENAALRVYREAEEQEKQKKAEQEKENLIIEATGYFNDLDINQDGILSKDEAPEIFDKNKDGEVDSEEINYFFGGSDNIDKDNFIATTWTLLKPLVMAEKEQFMSSENEETDTGNDEYNSESNHNAYDAETQLLVDKATEARHQYTEAERTVREIEANIRNIKQSLEKDYGPEEEFATLDGQCLEFEDKEYVYKLCVFHKVTQKSKNGGAEVGLGNWGEWSGNDDNKYSEMKYVNGVTCWNGPSRTTTVNVKCGLETKLLSVTEPYRCEYMIDFITPAACDESKAPTPQSSHDEL